MKFKTKTWLLILLIILLSFIAVIFLQKQSALQNPKSCLSKKKELLKMLKQYPHAIGWNMPHCDIFGNWRAQQEGEGYRWCVTKAGEMIPGTISRENPKQCYVNFIQKIYIVIMDSF